MKNRFRQADTNEMVTRRTYLSIALVIAFVFIGSMLALQSCKEEKLDLSTNFYPNLSLEDKSACSYYNWEETQLVDVTLDAVQPGMVTVRALNSEILFQTYVEEGVTQDVSIELPLDMERVFVEYKNKTEELNLVHDKIAFSL